MIELHIPADAWRRAPRTSFALICGLDVVIFSRGLSEVYPDHVKLVLAGNPRDLGMAVRRAMPVGGKIEC